MIGELLLLSGNDIPFVEAQVTMHPPTLKEIAYIGEEAFFTGCGFLDFSKKILNNEDKTRLSDCDDFDIFIMIMNKQTPTISSVIENALKVLDLIFPLYSVEVRANAIVLIQDKREFSINKMNFTAFRENLRRMLNLSFGREDSDIYNPEGDMAKRIAEKFQKRKKKLAELAGEKSSENIAILSRYASILAVGLQKNLTDLMQYTVYQLYDEFQRFQLKMQWDAYVQARMAGAKNLDEVDNWMIDLRDQGKNKTIKKNKK